MLSAFLATIIWPPSYGRYHMATIIWHAPLHTHCSPVLSWLQVFLEACSQAACTAKLEINYRSRPNIVALAAAILEGAAALLPKQLVPHKPAGSEPVHYWITGGCGVVWCARPQTTPLHVMQGPGPGTQPLGAGQGACSPGPGPSSPYALSLPPLRLQPRWRHLMKCCTHLKPGARRLLHRASMKPWRPCGPCASMKPWDLWALAECVAKAKAKPRDLCSPGPVCLQAPLQTRLRRWRTRLCGCTRTLGWTTATWHACSGQVCSGLVPTDGQLPRCRCRCRGMAQSSVRLRSGLPLCRQQGCLHLHLQAVVAMACSITPPAGHACEHACMHVLTHALHACVCAAARRRCFKAGGRKAHLELQSALRARGVPYVLVRDGSIFERGEVLDVLSYIRLALNPHDDAAFQRVFNTPARRLGDAFTELLERACDALHPSQPDAADAADEGLGMEHDAEHEQHEQPHTPRAGVSTPSRASSRSAAGPAHTHACMRTPTATATQPQQHGRADAPCCSPQPRPRQAHTPSAPQAGQAAAGSAPQAGQARVAISMLTVTEALVGRGSSGLRRRLAAQGLRLSGAHRGGAQELVDTLSALRAALWTLGPADAIVKAGTPRAHGCTHARAWLAAVKMSAKVLKCSSTSG